MSAKGKGGRDKGGSSSSQHSTTPSRGLVPGTVDSVKPTGRSYSANRNNPALPAKENDTSDTNKKMLDGVREWIKQLHKFVDSGKTDFTYPKLETGMTKEMTAIAKGIGQKNAYENIIKKLALSVTKANVKPEVDMETDAKMKPELDTIAQELSWNKQNKNKFRSYEATLETLTTWLDDLVSNNDTMSDNASANRASKERKKVAPKSATKENHEPCGKVNVLISEAKLIVKDVQEKAKRLEDGITSHKENLDALIQDLLKIHPSSVNNSDPEPKKPQKTPKTSKSSQPQTPPSGKDNIEENAKLMKSAKDLVEGLKQRILDHEQRLESQRDDLKALDEQLRRIHALEKLNLKESAKKSSNKNEKGKSRQIKQPEIPPGDKEVLLETSGILTSLKPLATDMQRIIEDQGKSLTTLTGDLKKMLNDSEHVESEKEKPASKNSTDRNDAKTRKAAGDRNPQGINEEKALLAQSGDSISNIKELVNKIKTMLETKEKSLTILTGDLEKILNDSEHVESDKEKPVSNNSTDRNDAQTRKAPRDRNPQGINEEKALLTQSVDSISNIKDLVNKLKTMLETKEKRKHAIVNAIHNALDQEKENAPMLDMKHESKGLQATVESIFDGISEGIRKDKTNKVELLKTRKKLKGIESTIRKWQDEVGGQKSGQQGSNSGVSREETDVQSLLDEAIRNDREQRASHQKELAVSHERFNKLRGQVDKLIETWQNGKEIKQASSQTSGDNKEPDTMIKLTDLILKKESETQTLHNQNKDVESRLNKLRGQVDKLIETWQNGKEIKQASSTTSSANNEPDTITNLTDLILKKENETQALHNQKKEIESRFNKLRGQVDKLIETWQNGKEIKQASSQTSGDNKEPDTMIKLTDLILKKESETQTLHNQNKDVESRLNKLRGQVDKLIETWQNGKEIKQASITTSSANNEPDTITNLTDLILKKENETQALHNQKKEIESRWKTTVYSIYTTVVKTFGLEEVKEQDDASLVDHIIICLKKHKMEEDNMVQVSKLLAEETEKTLNLIQAKPIQITTDSYGRYGSQSHYPKKYEHIYKSLRDAKSVYKYSETLTEQWQMFTLQIKELKEHNDDLSTRLSKLAGAALRHNNADIADLSDPNRPTKLGEQFSELYDNAWTDAFDELHKECGDRKAIEKLLNIVTDAYLYCQEESVRQTHLFENILFMPVTFDKEQAMSKDKKLAKGKKDEGTDIHLMPVQATLLSDLRKGTADISARDVEQIFQERNNQYFRPKGSKLQKYSEECVKICWHMSLQAPPVVIDTTTNAGDKMDKDRYKAYTKDGKKVEYVVWPAVYLNAGGSLMLKGVAQGK